MNIQVNGETQTLQDGLTVTELLQTLEIRTEQVAVELNLKILDRGDFPHSVLQNGDTVEILSFIGGGTEVLTHAVNKKAHQPGIHKIG
ncbi:MAG: sulfur carrier protein ThiS [Nitrospirales bacterium]